MPGLTERFPRGTISLLEAQAVREQLNRLLAHPLFTNSKRYPVLLTYVVEQALLGNPEELRERAIGVEAFGRAPDYDVAIDPVVRMAAAEVRKRLVQYYYNPEHAGQLVIELPLGTYLPVFREPGSRPAVYGAAAAARPGLLEGRHEGESAPADGLGPESKSPRQRRAVLWAGLGLAVLAVAILSAALGFAVGRNRELRQTSNLERFWLPVTSATERVTYCLGVPVAAADHQRLMPPGMSIWGGLDVSDVSTLARTILPLVRRDDSFRVVAATENGFSQLREGPVVLIGAFDNLWTMRITRDLPVGFEYAGQERVVANRKTNPKTTWAMQWRESRNLARDYAIVGRIHDRVTGQPVIIVAGILGPGTVAASEVVSNPAYLDAMLAKAPPNWEQLNLEAIIETQVIEGHPGPPAVIAVETWADSPSPGY